MMLDIAYKSNIQLSSLIRFKDCFFRNFAHILFISFCIVSTKQLDMDILRDIFLSILSIWGLRLSLESISKITKLFFWAFWIIIMPLMFLIFYLLLTIAKLVLIRPYKTCVIQGVIPSSTNMHKINSSRTLPGKDLNVSIEILQPSLPEVWQPGLSSADSSIDDAPGQNSSSTVSDGNETP